MKLPSASNYLDRKLSKIVSTETEHYNLYEGRVYSRAIVLLRQYELGLNVCTNKLQD